MNTEAKPARKVIGLTERIGESKMPSWIKSKIVRIGLSALALGGLAVGTYEAYQNDMLPVKPIHRTIETPSIFDPSALKSVIDPNNSIKMTLDEAIKAAPPVWQPESKTLTTILPIKFKDDRIATLHIEKAPNPYVGYKTPYVMTIDGLQAGDIIVSPMDGIIETNGGNGKGVVAAFFLYGKGPNGERLVMVFATTDLNLLIYPTPQPQNVKVSTPIKMGDPIGSLLTSDKHRKFAGQIQITGLGPLEESFDLASTSEGKAIVLK